MENIPRVTGTVRLPVTIPVHACLLDHHVEGQAVLPAVIAMQVIAETVKQFQPHTDISVMTRTRFDKFLHIQSGIGSIPAFVDIAAYENGDIGARLLTKNIVKKSPMTRIKEHASMYYPHDPSGFTDPHPVCGPFSVLEGACMEISPDRIYGELVPFGPAFRSIQGSLLISGRGAIAGIGTPAGHVSQSIPRILGSPFPLDGAYHAACVWGQRYAGMVAFPVGFEKRRVWHHTLPGEAYFCRILPVQTHPDLLVFDLWIYDENGVLFESNLGVFMKDVSGGRMKPPQWITAGPLFSALKGVVE